MTQVNEIVQFGQNFDFEIKIMEIFSTSAASISR